MHDDPQPPAVLPSPAVVVLVGPSGSGKTTWALARYARGEVVSSDALRAVVGTGEGDLDASVDAFAVLDAVVRARAGRRLTVVIDTLGLDADRRRAYVATARSSGLPTVAVRFPTELAVCRTRNASRDRPVPAPVLQDQHRKARTVDLTADGFDVIIDADAGATVEPEHLAGSASARRAQERDPAALRFVLQVSRFPWGDDPRAWLQQVARTAEACGFAGVAVMDHLLQIPQVGRAWDPIPEAYTTLGFLAACTERLELGALVSPVTFRSAPQLAKLVATLDVLSGGRAFCGVGAGWYEREHAAYALEFPPAGERLDALERTIGTLRACWGAGTKAHGGLPETTSYPRPLHEVPVIVGGGGERRTLDIAARLGDGCNLPSDETTLARKIAVLHEHLAAAGRDPDDVMITVLDTPVVGTDADHVNALVERLRGRAKASAYAAAHHAGGLADHVGRYRRLVDLGVSTVFVAPPDLAGPEEVERLAPLVAAFADPISAPGRGPRRPATTSR